MYLEYVIFFLKRFTSKCFKLGFSFVNPNMSFSMREILVKPTHDFVKVKL